MSRPLKLAPAADGRMVPYLDIVGDEAFQPFQPIVMKVVMHLGDKTAAAEHAKHVPAEVVAEIVMSTVLKSLQGTAAFASTAMTAGVEPEALKKFFCDLVDAGVDQAATHNATKD